MDNPTHCVNPELWGEMFGFVRQIRKDGERLRPDGFDWYDIYGREDWQSWQGFMEKRLEDTRGCLADPTAGSVVVDIGLDLISTLLRLLPNESFCQDYKALKEEVEVLRRRLACRPKVTEVEIAPQTLTLRSDLQREAIRLIAVEGLGRSWRIIESITAAGLGEVNSTRNVFRKLRKLGLLDFYRRDGKPVSWKIKTGGNSQLLVLTELGKTFCRTAFGQEPIESELAAVARKHSSVEHGIGILESHDHLLAAGYEVDDDPEAILEHAGERWHKRVEPDLVIQMNDADWPVEIQREVSERLLTKWERSLTLTERLVLILFNVQRRERQEHLLRQATQLPQGVIYLTSLEEMEYGNWEWKIIESPTHY